MLSIEIFRRVLNALRKLAQRCRSRRQLLALSDHMLKDIGISRADAVYEGDKPFWRA
jgi:uncharacterized protein YjiS (DUF1127 family)